MKHLSFIAIGAFCALLSGNSFAQGTDAQAKPFLDPLFTSNMVLQRGMQDPIWGWTTPGATVTVQIAGAHTSAVAGADGEWMAKLPSLPVATSDTLTVSGPQNVTLTNVAVGDVWLCTGQSNMEFGIGNGDNAKAEIAAADHPEVRLFYVPTDAAVKPTTQLDGQWEVCTPTTIQQDGNWNGFSAVGYYFGRDLQQNLKIPIGLLHSSVGGTPAEAWTSEEALEASLPYFDPKLTQLDAARDMNPLPKDIAGNVYYPTVLYNGMIHPLIPFAIKGAIWYQGESNAWLAYQYRTLLPTMINDWRTRWGEGDFPFLIVQLAGYGNQQAQPGDSAWAELRQAQWETAQNEPNAGIATAVDIGNATNIHPKDKQDVGLRLALVAEKQVYHEKVYDSGPVFSGMKVNGGQAILSFTHVDGGLVAKGGAPLEGFAIAGADKVWHWANAKIAGDKVIVSSPDVPNPVAVRYGWADYMPLNFYNAVGLPAFPFHTDDWPWVTRNNGMDVKK